MSKTLAGRLRVAAGAALVVAAGVAAVASRWLAPWAAFLLAIAFGVPAGLWIVGRVLNPAERTLSALRDGVRGFRDRDFSLEIAPGSGGELGELAALYNSIGEVLRDERRAIFEREMLLATVFEATPMAIVLTGARERIVFANRAARELFTVHHDRLEGQSFAEILARCPQALGDALAGGRDAIFSVERGQEPEVFHVARRSFELNGRRHDLTLVKPLNPELRRQEVEIWKRAIRTLTHEINNSLAPIASLARSLRQMADDPRHRERMAAALDVIEERSDHLKEFLAGYARFARLPAPSLCRVEWQGFLAELGELFPFVLDGEPPARASCFDPVQMQQALINLLKNALESGSPPAEIRLAVEDLGPGGTRFRVRDRGAGMSDEVMRNALLPFYTSKPAGSGLGLPLCREIVEAHGGHLRIERRPGGGIEVVCWLPPGSSGTATNLAGCQ